MNNPYEAPAAETNPTDEAEFFQELSYKELKKLRNHSSTITTLGVLWTLGALLQLFAAIALLAAGAADEDATAPIVLVLGLFSTVSAIGAFTRAAWGRGIGILMCVLSLLGFPIGTLIGILGLIAFGNGARLFGPDRYIGKELNKEYKHRKRNKIFD
jgi:hypothetical protein